MKNNLKIMKARAMVLILFVLGATLTGFGYSTPDLTTKSETKINVYNNVDSDFVIVEKVVGDNIEVDKTIVFENIDVVVNDYKPIVIKKTSIPKDDIFMRTVSNKYHIPIINSVSKNELILNRCKIYDTVSKYSIYRRSRDSLNHKF